MTAPGKNLEFFESRFYSSKIAPAPELANEITQYLENRPNGGVPFVAAVRILELKSRARDYTVIFARSGQRISLMNIFEGSSRSALNDYLRGIRDAFGQKGGRRE
jgi:hypothetical protein